MKILINQYSSKAQQQEENYKEDFLRGNIRFPLQYYMNNTVDPLYDLPVHWHAEFELIHIISGTYNLFIDGQEQTLERNDICIIPGKTLHGDARAKGQALYESVVFDIDLIRQHSYSPDEFITGIIQNTIVVNTIISHTNTAVSTIVQNFFDTVKTQPAGYDLLSSGYLLLLFGEVKRQHLYQDRQIIPMVKRMQAEQLEAVIDYIKKNYMHNITLEQMAETAHLSPKYFCRRFREVMKRSPIEYLNWFRINRACTALRETREKLPDIAAQCGFNDFSYFIKIFRRYKGMTPLKYRNMDDKNDTIKN